MVMLSTVVVTGGGTGGHVFTGLAVLDEVRRRHPEARTVFVGGHAGREVELVPRSDHELRAIDVRPLRLGGVAGAARGLVRIPAAVRSAARLLTELRPDAVLGVGGAPSGPTLVAARALGIPTLLHEQNAVAGLANRLAAGFVSRVLVGLPQARGRLAGRRDLVLTGNPVRRELAVALERRARAALDPAGLVPEAPLRVVVLGGSDGSSFLNRRMPVVLALAAERVGRALRVRHQVGVGDAETVRRVYAGARIEAEVVRFFDDMATVYAEVDLAVALAGAGTLAEVTLGAVPCFVVPLGAAADDHQRENARHYADRGAVCLVDERTWNDDLASAELARLLSDAAARHGLAERARAMAIADAAARIVDEMERVVARGATTA